MAKKRKVKAKRRVKAKVPRVPVKAPAARDMSVVQAEHILGLVGGILVMIAAIISIAGAIELVSSVISFVCGALMIILVYAIQKNARVSAIFLLVLSVLALILVPHGFIIGPVLGLIGAIIVLAKGR